MGYTPFFMVYGAGAVLPSDIRHDSPRVVAYIEADNGRACQDALDLLDEKRDIAAARSVIYQQDLCVVTAAGLKPRLFKKAIWCSVSSKIILTCTICLHLGKGPLWSAGI